MKKRIICLVPANGYLDIRSFYLLIVLIIAGAVFEAADFALHFS